MGIEDAPFGGIGAGERGYDELKAAWDADDADGMLKAILLALGTPQEELDAALARVKARVGERDAGR